MKQTRSVKITTTHRRSLRLAIRAHCRGCGREVETLTAAQAAEVLEVDDQTLRSLLAAGRIHVLSTVSGSLLICKDSLFI